MKRVLDLILAFVAVLILLLPIMLVAALVKMTSKGPALYWSDRVGKNNTIFKMPKFRSIWSILKGDMSFVGPRPALFNQNDLIALRTDQSVHLLIPGLTGWAQVNGRDELPIPQKVALDVEYLERQSLKMDIKIIWLTFIKVLKKDGVSH